MFHREFAIIDAENLKRISSEPDDTQAKGYNSIGSVDEMAQIWRDIEIHRGTAGLDLAVVTLSHPVGMMHCQKGWGGHAQFRCVHGKDGAEIAAEEYMTKYYPPGSLQKLIIGSGDGRFVALALAHQKMGAVVEVIARAGKINAELYLVADIVTLLPNVVVAA
jgi:hypothetical protein